MSKHVMHGPIAVIDVETTGLFPYRHDRVVEIAAVVLDERGAVEREFSSLVNPERDIGPSSIHGLSSADIVHAPTFAQIAGELMETMKGTVAVAAHNARFDCSFLQRELERIGTAAPDVFMICTMELSGGGSLEHCCDCYDVRREGDAHHALGDARSAARLLATLLPDATQLVTPLGGREAIGWPNIELPRGSRLTREESRRRREQPPTYLQRLISRVGIDADPVATEGSMMAYAAVLDRVLEDRHVSDEEGESLIEMAGKWRLSGDQVQACHHAYLERLALAALADGVVSDAERRDLHIVAKLLGGDDASLDAILCDAQSKLRDTAHVAPAVVSSDPPSLAGSRVCFTGELQCTLKGRPITRELAAELATSAGLHVVDNVSKKLGVLVLADAESQSGKAKKARSYGVRIMQEAVFWMSIGIAVD